jgi:hypothetical protein
VKGKTRPGWLATCRQLSDPSGREAGAAFLPATGQNFSAAKGGHPRAETVSALAVQIAGLKSAFHGGVIRKAKTALETKGCGGGRKPRTVRGMRGSVNTA